MICVMINMNKISVQRVLLFSSIPICGCWIYGVLPKSGHKPSENVLNIHVNSINFKKGVSVYNS